MENLDKSGENAYNGKAYQKTQTETVAPYRTPKRAGEGGSPESVGRQAKITPESQAERSSKPCRDSPVTGNSYGCMQ